MIYDAEQEGVITSVVSYLNGMFQYYYVSNVFYYPQRRTPRILKVEVIYINAVYNEKDYKRGSDLHFHTSY